MSKSLMDLTDEGLDDVVVVVVVVVEVEALGLLLASFVVSFFLHSNLWVGHADL